MKSINIIYKQVLHSDEVTGFHIARVMLQNKKDISYIRDYLKVHVDDNGEMIINGASFITPVPDKDIIKITGVKDTSSSYMKTTSILPSHVLDKLETNIYEMMATSLFESFTTAQVMKIKSTLGDQIVSVLEKNPTRLRELGFNYHDKRLKDDWGRIKKVAIDYELAKYLGATQEEAVNIVRSCLYKGESIRTILSYNPYALRDYISVENIDKFVRTIVWKPNHPGRINGLIKDHLYKLLESGSTKASIESVIEHLKNFDVKISKKEILEIDMPEVEISDGSIKLVEIIDIERSIAKNLMRHFHLNPAEDVSYLQPEETYLLDSQVSAVKNSMKTKMSVITGGPGVGKTTVTKSILNALQKHFNGNLNIKLCAPTGKAAQRLSESTGMDACTIHSLLGARNEGGFLSGKTSKIDADVLVIDEFSMADIYAMESIAKNLKGKTRLILLGDVDQLASVEAGNVLHDLINSKTIPVSRLTEPVRVSKESGIHSNAQLINKGKMPNLKHNAKGDWHFIEESDHDVMLERIHSLLTNFIPNHLGISLDNVQLLSPQYETTLGVDNLNLMTRSVFNNAKFVAKVDGKEYRAGDRVMQTVNDKQLGIVNGSVGVIKKIDLKERRVFEIDFDGLMVNVPLSKVSKLDVSFCSSIHKSQGSEYDVVIIPLWDGCNKSINRQMLYTGITRAKKHVFIIGSSDALSKAISDENQPVRETSLSELLKEYNQEYNRNRENNQTLDQLAH